MLLWGGGARTKRNKKRSKIRITECAVVVVMTIIIIAAIIIIIVTTTILIITTITTALWFATQSVSSVCYSVGIS